MSYLHLHRNLNRENDINFVEPTGDFYFIGDEKEIIEIFTSNRYRF